MKPYTFGVADYDRQQAERAAIPTFVVVPVRNAGDPVPAAELVPGVAGIIAVPNRDGEPVNIPAKWNRGSEWAGAEATAEGFARWNVLYVNDDVDLGHVPETVATLNDTLRCDPSHAVAYPNIHGIPGDGVVATHSDEMAGQTLSGYCFMLRGEEGFRFDEDLPWFYSDSALECLVRRSGRRVVCALGARIDHLRPMESTLSDPALLEQAIKDEALFADRYGFDPSTLFLARNPELVDRSRHIGESEVTGSGGSL